MEIVLPRRADWPVLAARLAAAFPDDPFLPVVRRRIALAAVCPFAFLRREIIGDVAILKAGGETAGFAVVKHLGGGESHLWYMAVEEARRNQGLGSRLLEHVLGNAARAGRKSMKLETETGSPAVRLYERHGFAVTGRLHLLAAPAGRPMPAVAPVPVRPGVVAAAGDAVWRLLLGVRSRAYAVPGGGTISATDFGGGAVVVFGRREKRPAAAFYTAVADSLGAVVPPGREAIVAVPDAAAAEVLVREHGFAAYKEYVVMGREL